MDFEQTRPVDFNEFAEEALSFDLCGGHKKPRVPSAETIGLLRQAAKLDQAGGILRKSFFDNIFRGRSIDRVALGESLGDILEASCILINRLGLSPGQVMGEKRARMRVGD